MTDPQNTVYLSNVYRPLCKETCCTTTRRVQYYDANHCGMKLFSACTDLCPALWQVHLHFDAVLNFRTAFIATPLLFHAHPSVGATPFSRLVLPPSRLLVSELACETARSPSATQWSRVLAYSFSCETGGTTMSLAVRAVTNCRDWCCGAVVGHVTCVGVCCLLGTDFVRCCCGLFVVVGRGFWLSQGCCGFDLVEVPLDRRLQLVMPVFVHVFGAGRLWLLGSVECAELVAYLHLPC